MNTPSQMRFVQSPACRTFRTCAFGFNPIGAQARHGCKAIRIMLAFCLLLVGGCGHEDAEMALHRQVQAGIEALAEHDHSAFMDVVADDFAIGSASCRERVCQYVYVPGVAVSLTKKKQINKN